MTKFAYHPDSIFVLPHLSITEGRCDNCPDVHAIQIHIGWIFWSLEISREF